MNMFDCAIKRETEAKAYYEKLAAMTAVPELKELFTVLAAAEQEHHDALVKIRESIDSPHVTFTAVKDAACLFKPLLTTRDVVDIGNEQNDAYKQVIQEEEEGIKFYEELAEQQKDGKTRDIILMIVEEERKHLSIIENIYSFVESPKTFLAWGEFSNLREY